MRKFKQWLLAVFMVTHCCIVALAVEPVVVGASATQEKLDQLDKNFSVFKEVQTQQSNMQDKRIADFSMHLTGFSTQITWIGVLITVLLFAIGIFGFFGAARRAAEEAEKSAENWFEKNSEGLIETLKKKAGEVSREMDGLFASLSELNKLPLPEGESLTEEVLDRKPKNSYSADEHYADGLLKHHRRDLVGALASFELAIQKMTVGKFFDAKKIMFYSGKAIVFYEQGKLKEAIDIFDNLQKTYGQDGEFVIREQMASILLNKGIVLDKQDKTEEVIAILDELEKRYGQDTASMIRQVVATALLNKSHALYKQNKTEEVIAILDELEKRYGQDTAPTIRKVVALALLSKGVVFAQQQKIADAIAILEGIEERYAQDADPAIREILTNVSEKREVLTRRVR